MTDGRESPPLVYANAVEMTAGPYDLVMDFGFKTPEQMKEGVGAPDTVVRVAMSLAHAKAMIPILAEMIATYEERVGKIPTPGFEDSGKG